MNAVIVFTGTNSDEHLNTIQTWSSKPHIVFADWLTESLKLKCPADEAPFAYSFDVEEFRTPQLGPKITRMSTSVNETFVDEAILRQYIPKSTPRVSSAHDLSILPNSQASFKFGMLSGKQLAISEFAHQL